LKSYLPVIECSGLTEVGPVREDNQDSIHLPDGLHPPDLGLLFAVADGMGGYSHGGVASKLALQMFSETLYNGGNKPNPKTLRRGVEAANLSVYKKAEKLGAGRMGTTLTAAFIVNDSLLLAHVGDSRAYLIRERQSTCLTADHTMVGDMVRSKLIPADKVRTHAQRSVLTKAIGIGLFVKPDIFELKLLEDDYLILCSDGVWSVILDHEFARVVNESLGVEQVSQNIIDLALTRETDDNVSVVAFHVRSLLPASAEENWHPKPSWFKKRRNLAQ
jgi:serine/threonine protein phosphatase PrpC